MLHKRLMVTWLWQALFVLGVIGGFVSHHLTVTEMMGRTRFVAMDSRDTFYLANLGNFETAQRIHEELAKMAAETIFSRNPDGFDYPERLERLFNPTTTVALNKDAARDADVFRSQGPLGDVIHNKRFFFAWKEGCLMGTYNTLDEATASLTSKQRRDIH